MLEQDYYERYWRKEFKKSEGVMNHPPEGEPNFKRVLPFLKAKCLDAGCGEGKLAAKLNEFAETVGMDISQEAVRLAKKKHAKINFKQGDVSKIPFKNEEFSTIVAFEIVEHVLDTDKMFSEFNRVLKKAGCVCISTPQLTMLKNIYIALFCFDRYYYPNNPHIRFFTRKTLREMLEKYGFEIVHYEKDGSWLGLIPKGQFVVARKVN